MVVNAINNQESTSASEEVHNYITLIKKTFKANLMAFITENFSRF